MKVIFSHGKESGPWGSKIVRLAEIAREFDYEVESIDYSGMMDPDERLAKLQHYLQEESARAVLVGSSMGGYVSLVAAEHFQCSGLFLLAPALYREGYRQQTYRPLSAPVEIVHGWSDEVIPHEASRRFAEEADCTLHLICGDHRLNDSLPVVTSLFRRFLEDLPSPR